MTDKLDVRTSVDSYRAQRGRFRILDVPDLTYLMVDGHGDPNTSPVFTEALETLYPVAYTLKFASRRELGRDHVVPPLEGLWWAQDLESFTVARDKSRWDWTLMLLVPDGIPPELVARAIEQVRLKKAPARLDDLRVETLSEARCVQTLHVGSFDDEAPVLAQLHDEFLPSNQLRPTGKHHEIYLTDSRRTAPDRQRTILRQPVAST